MIKIFRIENAGIKITIKILEAGLARKKNNEIFTTLLIYYFFEYRCVTENNSAKFQAMSHTSDLLFLVQHVTFLFS